MWQVVWLSWVVGRSLLSLVERVVGGGATIVLADLLWSLHGGTTRSARRSPRTNKQHGPKRTSVGATRSFRDSSRAHAVFTLGILVTSS